MINAAFIALAFAASAPAQADQQPGTIVVTAERVGDLRRALAACLARHCPPNEDVDASLALAEAEFLNGEYDDATTAIAQSLGRNRRFAATYPEPVADLYRSNARVLSHMGRDNVAERATWNILATLRKGIPQEDHRHFTARMEIIDFMLRHRNVREARRQLAELAEQARSAGRDDVMRAAQMRLLRIEDLIEPDGRARQRLLQLAAVTDPQRRYEMLSSRLHLAARYRDAGETARADAMLADIPRPEGDQRALLYSPPYQLVMRTHYDGEETPEGNVLNRMSDVSDDQWIDVAYWITPEGQVSDLEVVRQGSTPDWATPLLTSIRGRRFTPSSDGTPSYRLERYSYTAPFEVVTGSRIPQRSRRARVEFMDLTTPNETGRAPNVAVRPNS
jgi:hypothetical protein